MKKILSFLGATVTLVFLFSSVSYAQITAQDASAGFTTFAGLINTFTNTIVKALGTLLLSSAVVIFFFGVVQYIWGVRQGDPNKVKTGNEFMMWGLVALFVMFSIYGIIKLGQGIIFNGKDVSSITIPDVNLKTSGGSGGGSPAGGASGGSNPLAPSGGVCPDGVTKYANAGEQKNCPKSMLCPDGVTPYYNQSDRKLCPAAGDAAPAAMICPDGVTPYYNQSDRKNCPQPIYCPDGVNYYYNQSDRKLCPTARDVEPTTRNSASTGGDTSPAKEDVAALIAALPVCGSQADDIAGKSGDYNGCRPSTGALCNKGDGMWCRDAEFPPQ